MRSNAGVSHLESSKLVTIDSANQCFLETIFSGIIIWSGKCHLQTGFTVRKGTPAVAKRERKKFWWRAAAVAPIVPDFVIIDMNAPLSRVPIRRRIQLEMNYWNGPGLPFPFHRHWPSYHQRCNLIRRVKMQMHQWMGCGRQPLSL